MITKIMQKNNLIVVMILLLSASGCKRTQKIVSSSECHEFAMPMGDNYSPATVFDEDVEAFVLEEESLSNPFDPALHHGVTLAQNNQETVDDFTLEQLDSAHDARIVYFPYDGQAPSADQKNNLKETVKMAKDIYNKGGKVVCKGHSCKWGTATRAYNLALSNTRAHVIANALQEAGIPRDHIKVFGVGYEEPRALEYTQLGQAPNRRVEVYALCA